MEENELEKQVPTEKLPQYRKRGFYFLIIDYVFLSYIIIRIHSIGYMFTYGLEGISTYKKYLYYMYGYFIPTLQTPALMILLLYRRTPVTRFVRQATAIKNAGKFIFRHYVVISFIVFAFSGLFIEKISQFVAYLPENFQHRAVPTYYLSYVIIIIFFFIRTFLKFDYYQAFYLIEGDKSDYRYAFIFYLIIILAFTLHFLPYWIFF